MIGNHTISTVVVKEEGVKADTGKNQLDLLPPEALEAIGQIFTYGATKYEAHNWERGLKYSRVYAALLRHLFAFWKGETKDPETGLHPLAHAGCNLLFLLTYELRGMGKEFDDRFVSKQIESTNDECQLKESTDSKSSDSTSSKVFYIRDCDFFDISTDDYKCRCLDLFKCYKLYPDFFFKEDHSQWLVKFLEMNFPQLSDGIIENVKEHSERYYDIEIARFISTGVELDHNKDNRFIKCYNRKLIFPSFVPQVIRDFLVNWNGFSEKVAEGYYNSTKSCYSWWSDLYTYMYNIFEPFMADSFSATEIDMVTCWFLANFNNNVLILAIRNGYNLLGKGTPLGLGNGVFDE